MKREEQDKFWANLPEKKQNEYKENYKSYLNSIKNETHKSNYEWGIKEGEVKILIDTFGEHNLNPSLTYEDVVEELFDGEDTFYISDIGSIVLAEGGRLIYDKYKLPNNCTSIKQAEKLLAINKLLNVAKYLNKNEDSSEWVPDWKNEDEPKWHLCIDPDNKIKSRYMRNINWSIVYFRTEELARKALQILGEDTIRIALTTNY